ALLGEIEHRRRDLRQPPCVDIDFLEEHITALLRRHLVPLGQPFAGLCRRLQKPPPPHPVTQLDPASGYHPVMVCLGLAGSCRVWTCVSASNSSAVCT